jgi:signal recognition particle receptor subunit beta
MPPDSGWHGAGPDGGCAAFSCGAGVTIIRTADREIDTRIVYYGPGLSGKTTNLVNIHQRMPVDLRGPMRSIETDEERTLFFDFLPVEPVRIGGWALRFQLYSVPGQESYVRTRRAMLSGVDGLVFVADATPDRLRDNRASLEELADHLALQGRSLDDVPLVVQVNKMDQAAGEVASDVASSIGGGGWPVVEAVAVRGVGVPETLREIVQRVARAI